MRVFQSTYKDRNGVTQTTKRWYVELTDHRDRVRRIPAFDDKRASEELGRKLERLVSLRIASERPDRELTRFLEGLPRKLREQLARIDLLDASSVGATKPAQDHLDDFEQALRDGGATPDYVQKTVNRIKLILDGAKVTFPTELSAAAVTRYLADRRADGLSVKSSNHYQACVKSFAAWMVKERRISENPVGHLAAMNAKTDRRHVRRPLETDEVRRLLSATRTGPDLLGMTGEERFWLYRLAVETGLRSNELRSLTRASFDLSESEPTVTVEAGAAKNRKAATLPLRVETASELRAFIGNKLPTVGVFKLPRPEKIVTMLRADLSRARAGWIDEAKIDADREERGKASFLAYRDEIGRVADFHSLRATFASQLLRSGVDVRTAKDLMRHSTIAMTADVYACTMRGSLGDAIKRLPDWSTPKSEQLRATGTDGDDSVLAFCLARDGSKPAKSVRGGSTRNDESDDSQPLQKTGTYGDSTGMVAHASANRMTLPPRGVEPLSSG